MGDADSKKFQPNTELEIRLYKNILAARRDYIAAAQARSTVIGELLNDDPDSIAARRQALDHEQHSLEQYVRALREYNGLVSEGKLTDESESSPAS